MNPNRGNQALATYADHIATQGRNLGHLEKLTLLSKAYRNKYKNSVARGIRRLAEQMVDEFDRFIDAIAQDHAVHRVGRWVVTNRQYRTRYSPPQLDTISFVWYAPREYHHGYVLNNLEVDAMDLADASRRLTFKKRFWERITSTPTFSALNRPLRDMIRTVAKKIAATRFA